MKYKSIKINIKVSIKTKIKISIFCKGNLYNETRLCMWYDLKSDSELPKLFSFFASMIALQK